MKKHLKQSGVVSLLFIVIVVAVLAALVFVAYSQYQIKQNVRKATPEQGNQVQTFSNVPITTQKNVSGTLSGQVLCTDKVNDRPCQSDFTLTYATSNNPGESVSDFAQIVKSDSGGKYSVNIPPGSYNITPLPKNGYPIIVPIHNPAVVSAGKTTSVTIRYMDGTK